MVSQLKMGKALNKIFYNLKPITPRRLQLFIRRQIIFQRRNKYQHIWPIAPEAGNSPKKWSGWPDQKQFAFVITHDVDTQKGHDICHKLLNLEERLGFRSSFNFVPERYEVSDQLRKEIVKRGFEVGVHGLNHDGRLYHSKRIFQNRAIKINHYLSSWEAVGFRSPSMHHNIQWMHDLNIEYDASTFDTDPFEPQSDGVNTIFPFWIQNNSVQKGFVELPYTLAQDFTLFTLMRENNINIWQRKLRWIAKNGGMALVNVHPDYMNFDGEKCSIEEYPAKFYEDFLCFIKTEYNEKYWHVLPKEMAKFIKNENKF